MMKHLLRKIWGQKCHLHPENGGSVPFRDTGIHFIRPHAATKYQTVWYFILIQSHFTAVSQYVLVSTLLCGHLTRYCFLFKCLGLKCVVLSLWGALSDEGRVCPL
jgi:hypothetical protein